jgi:hypothetical protein
MFPDPTRPLLRIRNYYTDQSLFNARWFWDFKTPDAPDVIELPANSDSYTKSINPNWRRSWPMLLLRKTGHSESFRPIIQHTDRPFMTIFPVKTHSFTMRIGPEVLRIHLYGWSFERTVPELYNPDNPSQPLVLNQSRMLTFIEAAGLSVTHV